MKNEINEDEYPSNSRQNRHSVPVRNGKPKSIEHARQKVTNRPKVDMVVRATVRKKTLAQSIANVLVGDGEDNVLTYVWQSVLLPAFKSTLQDMLTSGLDMVLFNGEGRLNSRSNDRNRTQISYGSMYSGGKTRGRVDTSRRSPRDRFNLDNVFFKYGDDAGDVLSAMGDQLEEFGAITVADFYEMVDLDGATWAHRKYGWVDLREAYVTHTRDGYHIVMPQPKELE